MEDFKHDGFSYVLYIRPWKKGNTKYEAIKYETGFRNLWDNISYEEYLSAKKLAILK